MKRGQHKMLLQMILNCIEDSPELQDFVRQAIICSRSPGTSGYQNKCEFPDGSFIAVLQSEGGRNEGNQLVWGWGSTVKRRSPRTIEWTPSDYDLRLYAQQVSSWVRDQLCATR